MSKLCPRVQEAHPKDAGGSSFTRVMIGNVRPDVLSQIHMDDEGRQLCRCMRMSSQALSSYQPMLSRNLQAGMQMLS